MNRVYPPAAYKRVAGVLREHIELSLYGPGQKLPTIAELAVMYGIKPGAAHAALNLLCTQGLAEARRGRGYYVCST